MGVLKAFVGRRQAAKFRRMEGTDQLEGAEYGAKGAKGVGERTDLGRGGGDG